jgi:hypothetical protein
VQLCPSTYMTAAVIYSVKSRSFLIKREATVDGHHMRSKSDLISPIFYASIEPCSRPSRFSSLDGIKRSGRRDHTLGLPL